MEKLKKERPPIKQYVEKSEKRRDYIQHQNTLLKIIGSIVIYILQILQKRKNPNEWNQRKMNYGFYTNGKNGIYNMKKRFIR